MASKGQKFKKYSDEFKKKVLEEYLSGEGGSKALAKKYNISFHTINTWIEKAKHPEKYAGMGLKKGRKKDSEIDWKERYEILKNTRPSSRHNERESSVHQHVSERI